MLNDDVVFPSDTKSDPDPPPTDNIYPVRTILGKTLIDTVRLAIAIGLGLATVIALISLIVASSGTSLEVQDFFATIMPGFTGGNLLISFVMGFLWAFIYGFVFGAIVGVVYNSLIRSTFIDGDSWESLS